jgi:hypothetical protein
MGFWERVLNILTGGKGVADPMIYWVYVRCDKCGEPLKARVDLRNELSAEFGERREDTVYTTRKVLIGSGRCHAPVEVRLTFDWRRNPLRREISGGSFLTEQEYLAEVSHHQTTGEHT